MTVISFTLNAELLSPIPISLSYTLNGQPVSRIVGALGPDGQQIWFDEGTSVTALAPASATEGSIQNTPPDLKTYRFRAWQLQALPLEFTQSWTGTPEDGDFLFVYYDLVTTFQTRSPSRRASKLQAKTDEEVAQIRTTALKPLQVKNQAVTSYEQTHMEERLGTVLCAAGIIGNDQHHYRNFAQELYGLRKTFTQLTLTNEAKLRANKWYGRGLVWATLQTTAKLQGIDIGTAPP